MLAEVQMLRSLGAGHRLCFGNVDMTKVGRRNALLLQPRSLRLSPADAMAKIVKDFTPPLTLVFKACPS